MREPILFTRKAIVYVHTAGPVTSIRNSIMNRRFITGIFWVILIAGIITVIVRKDFMSAILTVGIVIPIAIWGQYWRDIDIQARVSLRCAFLTIADEMRRQNIDPLDTEQRKRFNPSLITDMEEMVRMYWQWIQDYDNAPDVQHFISNTPNATF